MSKAARYTKDKRQGPPKPEGSYPKVYAFSSAFLLTTEEEDSLTDFIKYGGLTACIDISTGGCVGFVRPKSLPLSKMFLPSDFDDYYFLFFYPRWYSLYGLDPNACRIECHEGGLGPEKIKGILDLRSFQALYYLCGEYDIGPITQRWLKHRLKHIKDN